MRKFGAFIAIMLSPVLGIAQDSGWAGYNWRPLAQIDKLAIVVSVESDAFRSDSRVEPVKIQEYASNRLSSLGVHIAGDSLNRLEIKIKGTIIDSSYFAVYIQLEIIRQVVMMIDVAEVVREYGKTTITPLAMATKLIYRMGNVPVLSFGDIFIFRYSTVETKITNTIDSYIEALAKKILE